ncbi:hypothetical protein E2C01_082401 [Portunus trituberculatus]|uniref:Uncharacterized protein n=1 Tax=Portunus trituberculatus TaxID=210409 RepID=A0A5B7J0R8_PORTR|nr:hypothetical protein [Portunus trituberculatus]
MWELSVFQLPVYRCLPPSPVFLFPSAQPCANHYDIPSPVNTQPPCFNMSLQSSPFISCLTNQDTTFIFSLSPSSQFFVTFCHYRFSVWEFPSSPPPPPFSRLPSPHSPLPASPRQQAPLSTSLPDEAPGLFSLAAPQPQNCRLTQESVSGARRAYQTNPGLEGFSARHTPTPEERFTAPSSKYEGDSSHRKHRGHEGRLIRMRDDCYSIGFLGTSGRAMIDMGNGKI